MSNAAAIPLVRELASVKGSVKGSAKESELYARAAEGDPDAIASIYDDHHQAVRAFATRLLGDPSAAEDLVHEVFITLPKALRRWKSNGRLRTFLIGIAVNHARHHARSARRRRDALARLGKEPAPSSPDTPEAHIRREQLAAALRRGLDRLPMRQRVAFVLCEVEERTSRQAAEIVGVSEGTIRSRLHHAKNKLRASLAREGFQ